jgi:hypothetical protein
MLHSNSLNLRFILTKFDYVRMKLTKFDYVGLKLTKLDIIDEYSIIFLGCFIG